MTSVIAAVIVDMLHFDFRMSCMAQLISLVFEHFVLMHAFCVFILLISVHWCDTQLMHSVCLMWSRVA